MLYFQIITHNLYCYLYLFKIVAYPLGKLPFLEFNGKSYNQSIAIARYLAKQLKLTGKNDLEDLVIDGVVDTIVDIRLGMYRSKEIIFYNVKSIIAENHVKCDTLRDIIWN